MKGKYVKAAYVPLIGTGAAGDIVWSDAVHVTGNGTDSGAAAVKSANAELATADITTGENTALFQFVKGTSFYQTTAGSDVQQIRYSFAAEDAKATVKVVVNGTETEELSGSAVLTNGRNLIEVKVTAEDGVTVERYRFTISRQGENNALLESLQVNGQAIELTEGVYEYSLPLATGTTTAQVAATAQSTRASVSIVNGTKVTSAVQTVQSDVTVEPGTNEITIRVTPETSAGPVYYKLKLKVPNASNARLEALNFGENVSLAEKFDADTFNYTASATESGVTISATAEEADAIVNVIWKDTVIQTGTGSAATELGLTEGDNTVKVRVTSADGSTEKIYTVTVHASGETWLSDLDWESQTSGDSGNPTRKDKSCGNNTLTLWDGSAEETFEKGIGSHADSTIIYDLTGKGYTSFSSYYGVDRETKVNPSQASITFKVYVDGNLKFTSAEMGTNTAKGFTGDIDITGATELKLVMEKGTNNWSDHGDWANAKLTKPFTAPQSFAVTVRANDPAMGSAAADQNEYQKYDTATVTATANEGYHFVNWTNAEGTVVSESNPYVFGVTEDVTLTANFEADPVTKYTLATEVNDAAMGSVTVTPSQSEYDENSSVTVTAVPASDDYEFVNWTNPDTNAEVSTEAEYTFEITGNTKLKANFREKEKSYHVQAESADEVMGTVSVAPETSGNVYVKDTEVTVTATPNAGYEFVQWNKITDNNGTEVSEKVEGAEAAYTFAVTEDVHLRAEFRLIPVVKNQYRVTVTSSDTAMGTVSMDHEDGVYEDGEDVTVTATAAEGYHFVGWKLKDSEDILSTDAKYIFTISENVELIGVFEKDEEPEQVITAEEIVRQIVADKSFATSVKKGTKKLTLPGVPENAQIEISSVNPEGIIALNGEVTAPKADTEVIVTVKVTGTDGSVSYADFKVMVEGSGEPENPDQEKPDNGNNGGNNSDNDNNNNSNAGNNDNNSGNKGDNGNADQRTVKATKTGDTTNFALYGMAMAAAGAVIATLVYRRKRS